LAQVLTQEGYGSHLSSTTHVCTMALEGQEVFATVTRKLLTSSGIKTAVRWGDRGVINESDGTVLWDKSCISGEPLRLPLIRDQVSREQPTFWPGQWVQFKTDINFCSSRRVLANTLAVVLDKRVNCASVLVRAAPFASQEAFDLSVDADEIEAASGPSQVVEPTPDELPGGFRAADVVFSTQDLGSPSVCVGRGDVGLVMGRSSNTPGNMVYLRFESHLVTGDPFFTNLPPECISRQPQLCPGRRVNVDAKVEFADGSTLSPDDVVTLIDDTDEQEAIVMLTLVPGEKEKPKKFSVPAECLSVHTEIQARKDDVNVEARLMVLEDLSQQNDAAGKQHRTVSMILQNLFPLCGYGPGLMLSFSDMEKSRPTIIANARRAMILRRHEVALDGRLDNETNVMFNHTGLVDDAGRTGSYAAAIGRVAAGRRVLDIGTGPYCLLACLCLGAGADSVDAVEGSERSVEMSLAGFQGTLSKAGVPSFPKAAPLDVVEVCTENGSSGGLRATVRCRGDPPQKLSVFQGMSSDKALALRGGYTMIVHEILGDFAGTENAAAVLADIHERGLVGDGCTFVPRSSSTLLAPTAALSFTTMERLLHRLRHKGSDHIEPLTRYCCRFFHDEALIASPQPLEVLDFAGGPALHQQCVLEFRTDRDSDFDGVHMHLFVDLDGISQIDVLKQSAGDDKASSWNTTYIRLLEEPMRLSAGSRIVCTGNVNLEAPVASYSISVAVGEPGNEQHVADFAWKGG